MPSSEVRPLHVADTVHEGDTYPVYAYAVFHPDGLVLVDTGMIESHQEIEEYHPTLYPLTGQDVPLEEVEFEGANYVELEGEAEIVPGIRVLPAPGHTDGHQSVLVDTGEGLVVIGGDVAHSLDELAKDRRLLDLEPKRIWITHSAEPLEP